MLSLGAKKTQMGPMDIHHILMSRLRLMIIMLKAYLKRYPIGDYRLQGMIHNARIIGDEAVFLWGLTENAAANQSVKESFPMDREFYEHLKILTLLIGKIESNKAPDQSMIEKVTTHLNAINRQLLPKESLSEMQFLKVA